MQATKPLCNADAFTDGQKQRQGSSKVPTSAVVRHVPDVKGRRRHTEPSAVDKTFFWQLSETMFELGKCLWIVVVATADATSDATVSSM